MKMIIDLAVAEIAEVSGGSDPTATAPETVSSPEVTVAECPAGTTMYVVTGDNKAIITCIKE